MKPHDSIRLFDHLFEGLEGQLCIAMLDRVTGRLRHRFLAYPEATAQATKVALAASGAGRDAYFCAHLLINDQRRKGSAALIKALWADGDGAEIPDGFPPPTAVVESSPGRHHYYWRLDEPIDAVRAESLNRAIANQIGTDKSGWDLTQLLRVPGTKNYKREDADDVVLQIMDDRPFAVEELEAALDAQGSTTTATPTGGHDGATKGGKGQADSEGPPVLLSASQLRVWRGTEPLPPGQGNDRSKRLARMAYVLRAAGAEHDQIVSALRDRDVVLGWRKYADRRDADLRYRELADAAVDRVIPRSGGGLEPGRTHSSGFALTDLGNAERLGHIYCEDLKYVPGQGWFAWDGQRWLADETTARRFAAESARLIRQEAAAANGSKGQELWRHASNSESKARIDAALSLAQTLPGLACDLQHFDTRDDELNVRNGVLNLQSGALREHDRESLHTKLSDVEFIEGAECPLFEAFIDEIFEGDQGLLGYCQRVFGYCLSGRTTEQVFFLLHGSGANGKSTLVRLLLDLVGDYGSQLTSETLLRQMNRSQTNDLARLRGVRVAVANEFSAGRKLDEALMKQLTGGERVSARMLYREFAEFEPKCKILVSSNHLPDITGTDYGIWRRVHLLPFEFTVPEGRRDPALNQKLRAELPGVLNWSLIGYNAWREGGLRPPQVVRSAVEQYRSERDSVGSYVEEACQIGPKYSCTNQAVYDDYEFWCDSTGRDALSKTEFLKEFRNRFSSERTRSARGFKGVRPRGWRRREAA